jgi:hypothetical protein
MKTRRIFMLRSKPMLFAVLAVALALPGVALGQDSDGAAPAVGLNYFDNANSTTLPDGTVRITTPHNRLPANGATGHGPNQCALIYVLKPDQELAACCGCPLTPNQLLKLSVNKDLTGNPYGAIGPSGTIAIVPSIPNCAPVGAPPVVDCDPGLPPLTGESFVTAWATHLQDSGAITEDDFDFSTGAGAAATVTALVADCNFVQSNGSGAGVCTCGSGSGTVW